MRGFFALLSFLVALGALALAVLGYSEHGSTIIRAVLIFVIVLFGIIVPTTLLRKD